MGKRTETRVIVVGTGFSGADRCSAARGDFRAAERSWWAGRFDGGQTGGGHRARRGDHSA
jgi:hypothetical protein